MFYVLNTRKYQIHRTTVTARGHRIAQNRVPVVAVKNKMGKLKRFQRS